MVESIRTHYYDVGDNYDTKDPFKKKAQQKALETAKNVSLPGFSEITESRGESAYVWREGRIYRAANIEGLGTGNLAADGFSEFAGRTHYETVGQNTVASIINDLVSVGAKPLIVHAYWAIEDNSWLSEQKASDLVDGFKEGCDISEAIYAGGETATLKGIIVPGTIDLAGSANGIIGPRNRYLRGSRLRDGDRIVLLKSTGVNMNGLSLGRDVAKKIPQGYGARLPNGQMYGDALLNKSNIYAALIQDILNEGVDLHYTSNITGHGLRKVMRAVPDFTYVLEKIFQPQEVFNFIQEHTNSTDRDMYETFNMGQDFALFLPEKDVAKTQSIIDDAGFESLNGGFLRPGEKQLIVEPIKDLVFGSETLDLR